MPTITPVNDLNSIYNVGQSILTSIVEYTSGQGIVEIPERRYVGFANPPEDCCPDLVVWADSPRTWDGNTFDSGLRETKLLCTGLWAIDYGIRWGLCYIQSPEPEAPAQINRGSQTLYRVGHALMKWICMLPSGVVPELQPPDSTFRPGQLRSYNQGGCAGWEFTLTVGLE